MKGGPESFEGLNTPEKIVAFFDKYYPTAIEMLGGYDAIIPQMLNNPVGLLGKGAVCLCGACVCVCVCCVRVNIIVELLFSFTRCGVRGAPSYFQR